MTTDECRQEEKVLEAITTGVWTNELESHAVDCPDCAELVEVDLALQGEARIAMDDPGLPEAALIWRRFEFETEQRRLREATLPIRLLEKLAFGAGLLVALYGLVASWPVLGTWLLGAGSSLKGPLGAVSLSSLSSSSLSSSSILLDAMPNLGASTLVLLCLTGFLGMVLHGLYTQWSET